MGSFVPNRLMQSEEMSEKTRISDVFSTGSVPVPKDSSPTRTTVTGFETWGVFVFWTEL